MLTVLHKMANGDSLYEAVSVQTHTNANNEPFVPTLFVMREGDLPMVSITVGEVFVMNTAGATVAKYDYRTGTSPKGMRAT